MAPSPCSDPPGSLVPEHRALLLDLAADSIEYGLHRHEPFPVKVDVFPTVLTVHRASFVTLTRERALRGCIGGLEPVQPLVQDVAHHAFQAAFCDPRFPPVTWEELESIDISLSILSPPELIPLASEEDLPQRLQPYVDGLILQEDARHATFLPAVWESIPDPREFIAALKRKGGWPRHYWSDRMIAYRYTTERIP